MSDKNNRRKERESFFGTTSGTARVSGDGGHSGGGIGAPLAGKILGETLDYLNIESKQGEN